MLVAWPGLGIQPHNEALADLRIKISKTQVINIGGSGSPLNNASKRWPRGSQIEVKKMCTLQDGGCASHDANQKLGPLLIFRGKVNFIYHPWSNKLLKRVEVWCRTELELGVSDSWITNQLLDPTNKKFVKLTFTWIVFPKYDNFKIISTDNIFLSICLELNERSWTTIEQNSLNYVVKACVCYFLRT